MKSLKLAVGSIALASFFFFSCSKTDTKSSISSRILGTWNYDTYITDNNNNGVIDATDQVDTLTDFGFKVTFNANGTGSTTSLLDTTIKNLTWNLANNNTELGVKLDTDTTFEYSTIVSCTATQMQLKNTGDSLITWLNLIK